MLLSELSSYYFHLTDHWLSHPVVHLRLSQMVDHTLRIANIRALQSSSDRWGNRHFRHYVLYKAILYGWIIYALFRVTICAVYAYAIDPDLSHLPDPAMRRMLPYITIRLGPDSLLLGSLMSLFALYIDYAMTLQWHPTVLELLHALVVVNKRDFVALNPALFPPIELSVLKPWQTCTELKQWVYSLWWCAEANFSLPVMANFETHTALVRVRYIVITTVMDLVSLVVNGFLGLLFSLALVVTLVFVWAEVCANPLLVCDGLMLIYVVWNSIRMTIFSTEVIANTAFGYRWLFHRTHNPQIHGAIHRYRAKPSARNRAQLLYALEVFRRKHIHVTEVAGLTNRTTMSRLMFLTLVTNLGANVMLVSCLLYVHLTLSEVTIIGVIIAAQASLSMTACSLSIVWSDSLYCSDWLLLQALQVLHQPQPFNQNISVGSQFSLSNAKLKLATFYELIHARKSNRFYFTVGPLAKITKNSMFQFVLVYSDFLFFTFRLLKSGTISAAGELSHQE